jgi:transposase
VGASPKVTALPKASHNKMENISKQAYGFRNFETYRVRVKVLCG